MLQGLIDIQTMEENFQYLKTQIPVLKLMHKEGLELHAEIFAAATKSEMKCALIGFKQGINEHEALFCSINKIRCQFYN